MLTAGGRAREAVLDWVGAVLKHNVARTMMQANRQKTSSDGFMLNLTSVLLQLCVPFMDPSSPKVRYWHSSFHILKHIFPQQNHLQKVNMIEPSYLLTSTRFGAPLDDTKLAATSEEVKHYLAERKSDGKPPGFITECFFLTLKCMSFIIIFSQLSANTLCRYAYGIAARLCGVCCHRQDFTCRSKYLR